MLRTRKPETGYCADDQSLGKPSELGELGEQYRSMDKKHSNIPWSNTQKYPKDAAHGKFPSSRKCPLGYDKHKQPLLRASCCGETNILPHPLFPVHNISKLPDTKHKLHVFLEDNAPRTTTSTNNPYFGAVLVFIVGFQRLAHLVHKWDDISKLTNPRCKKYFPETQCFPDYSKHKQRMAPFLMFCIYCALQSANYKTPMKNAAFIVFFT